MGTIDSFDKLKMDIEPPKKLYQALALAMKDLEAVEKMDDTRVNMLTWVNTFPDGCHVCLAGAVMYMNSDSVRSKTCRIRPENFSKQWEIVFEALDLLRCGAVMQAVEVFTGKKSRKGLNMNVDPYGENEKRFKRNMKKIIKVLKDHDL